MLTLFGDKICSKHIQIAQNFTELVCPSNLSLLKSINTKCAISLVKSQLLLNLHFSCNVVRIITSAFYVGYFFGVIYCSNLCFLSTLVIEGVVGEKSGVNFLLRCWGCICGEKEELLLIVDDGVEFSTCEDKPAINLSTRTVCCRFSATGYSFFTFDCSAIQRELANLYFTERFKFPRISRVRIKNHLFL